MSDQDRVGRPDGACLTCLPPTGTRSWRMASSGYVTCQSCADHLSAMLGAIAERYDRLDPTPGAYTAADSGPRPPGFGSRAPASDHIIVMRDPRSSTVARVWVGSDGRVHAESQHPPLSVWSVMDTIAWDVAEQRDYENGHGQCSVDGLCRWLDSQLDWLTRRPDIVDVAELLRAVLAQLKPVTGDPRRRIGVCPNTLDPGTETQHECGAPLYAPTTGDTIMCGACRREWPRSEWLRLGAMLDAS